MSALNLVRSDGRSLEPPVGYLGEGCVEADNVRSLDPQLMAAAEQLESAEEVGELCQRALEFGVAVWTVSQSRQLSADLSEQVDRFPSRRRLAHRYCG